MITSRWVLVFEVSIEPYWSAQHDRIFESGATAFLVAKFDLKDVFISELCEELMSLNSEYKYILLAPILVPMWPSLIFVI